MKKLKFILITCLIIFSACTNIVGDEPVVLDSTPPEETFEIDQPLLQKYLSLARKDNVLSQIKPIKESGKTLAYYVEYKEGGWELIAADKRFAPSLMKSSEGKIDDFAIFDGAIAQIKNCDINEPNAIWEVLSPLKPKEKPLSKRGITTGMWIGIDTIITNESIGSNHIMTTTWGQSYPWNSCTPYKYQNGSLYHTKVGCGPVACGQVIYHFRKNNHRAYAIPTDIFLPMIEDATPNFSDYAASGWANLEQSAMGTAIYTPIFLSYLGFNLLTPNYGLNNSTTNTAKFEDTLTNFGLTCDKTNTYSYSLVLGNLRQGKPVIVAGNGHAYVIDRYSIVTNQAVGRYYWDADHNVTEEEYFKYPQWMFSDMGNNGKDELEMVLASSETICFGMNWGFNGLDNDILYTVYTEGNIGIDEFGTILQGGTVTYSPYWQTSAGSFNVQQIFYNIREQY